MHSESDTATDLVNVLNTVSKNQHSTNIAVHQVGVTGAGLGMHSLQKGGGGEELMFQQKKFITEHV